MDSHPHPPSDFKIHENIGARDTGARKGKPRHISLKIATSTYTIARVFEEGMKSLGPTSESGANGELPETIVSLAPINSPSPSWRVARITKQEGPFAE